MKDLGTETGTLTDTPSISYRKTTGMTLRIQDAEWQSGAILEEAVEVPSLKGRIAVAGTGGDAYGVVHYRLPVYDLDCGAVIRALKITVAVKSAAILYLNEKEIYRIELVSVCAILHVCSHMYIYANCEIMITSV